MPCVAGFIQYLPAWPHAGALGVSFAGVDGWDNAALFASISCVVKGRRGAETGVGMVTQQTGGKGIVGGGGSVSHPPGLVDIGQLISQFTSSIETV